MSNLNEHLIESDYSNEKKMSMIETFKQSLFMGCISFGGPVAHIGLFKKTLISQQKLISEKKFTSLFTLCNILPGPTSSQLYTAICTVKTGSLLGGLISFFGFNFPSLLVILLISNLAKSDLFGVQLNSLLGVSLISFIHQLIIGFSQGALSIVIQAGLSLGKKFGTNPLQVFLLVFSALFYSVFNDYSMMMIIMIFSGSLSLIFFLIFNYDSNNSTSSSSSDEFPPVRFSGVCSLAIFASLFTLLVLCEIYFSDFSINFYLMERFFRIGSLIFGGGHVVIPMILSEFTKNNLISENDVLNGFSLISLMPGPMFNISGYVGSLINGVFGGLLSAISIFAPGILLVFATFPYLNLIRKYEKAQMFLKGVSSASIGFIFSAAFTLWVDTCFANGLVFGIIGTINVGVCFILLNNLEYFAPLVIFIGGCLFSLTHFIK